jgi:hypothetical protein
MGGETTTGGTTLGEVMDDEQEVDLSSDPDEIGETGPIGEPPVRWTAQAAAANEPDSGNGRTATSRRVTPTPPTPPRSRGWRTAAIVGLIVAGLLTAAVVLLWGEVDDARSDADDARALVVNARDASARVQVLEGTVTDLEKQLADLKTSTDALKVSVGGAAPTADVDAKVTALTARADQLAACVNAYMDAVGAWSQNPTASTFTYHRC